MQQQTLHFGSFSSRSSADRRRYPRKKVPDAAATVVEIVPGHRCSLVDLSEGGMSLRSQSYVHFPPKGKFSFTLPNSSRIEVLAQLAWVSRRGTAGLKFLELSPACQSSLSTWMAANVGASASTLASRSHSGPRMSLTAVRAKAVVLHAQQEDALQFIAEQMIALTDGTGAVIALEAGADIRCVASAGRAPAVGTTLKPDSGLSGECVRTGTIVRCEDAGHDRRVNSKTAKALGFRSMIILPLRREQKTIGILEVFAAEPRHFDNGDVALLTNFAELVLELQRPQKLSKTLVELKPRVSAKEMEPVAAPVREKESPKLELVKPKIEATKVVPVVALRPEPLHPPVSSASCTKINSGGSGRFVCDVCGHQNAAGARDCEACDVPLPLAVEMEEKRITRKAVAFEIPERDDRWERLVAVLAKPVLLIILLLIALFLVRAHWKDMRAASSRWMETGSSHQVSASPAASVPRR